MGPPVKVAARQDHRVYSPPPTTTGHPLTNSSVVVHPYFKKWLDRHVLDLYSPAGVDIREKLLYIVPGVRPGVFCRVVEDFKLCLPVEV